MHEKTCDMFLPQSEQTESAEAIGANFAKLRVHKLYCDQLERLMERSEVVEYFVTCSGARSLTRDDAHDQRRPE